ncbi:hypothetical protein [Cohnella laeviribosi]|uniref:hypothetical protein n=1 Tax=Cohnella laeviribosi TaxID=380174 RepID=UPI003D1C1B77
MQLLKRQLLGAKARQPPIEVPKRQLHCAFLLKERGSRHAVAEKAIARRESAATPDRSAEKATALRFSPDEAGEERGTMGRICKHNGCP